MNCFLDSNIKHIVTELTHTLNKKNVFINFPNKSDDVTKHIKKRVNKYIKLIQIKYVFICLFHNSFVCSLHNVWTIRRNKKNLSAIEHGYENENKNILNRHKIELKSKSQSKNNIFFFLILFAPVITSVISSIIPYDDYVIRV